MTDNEIIKALECIAREEIKCAECAYGEYCYPVCQNLAGGDALDLIKRQKAEIERLKGNAPRYFISDKKPSRYFKVKSSQPILIYPYEETKIELVPSAEQIKAEAIKDFAERLKEKAVDNYRESLVSMSVDMDEIDDLVKEMIGEANESIQQEDC